MQRKLKVVSVMTAWIMFLTLGIVLYHYCIFKQHFDQLYGVPDDFQLYHNTHVTHEEEEPSQEECEEEGTTEVPVIQHMAEGDDTELEENESVSDDENDFLVVNRSSEYLLDAAINFYKQHNLEAVITQLTDAWEPYNDWQLRQSQTKQTVLKKKSKTKKAIKVKKSPLILSKSTAKRARFSWPIDPSLFWLSSRYGPRKHKDGSPGFHHGIDMAAVKGTRIKAAAKGRVIAAGYTAGWGNNILIDHLDGRFKTRYAHLDKIRVYHGQYVTPDSWIGDVGATGRVRKKGKDASHLHFEVYDQGKRVNPLVYIS